MEWHASVRPSDFIPLSRVRLLKGWQTSWDGSDMGRNAYGIWPVVSFMPLFKRFDGDRVIISMINKVGESFMPQKSYETDRYRDRSNVRLFMRL
jgi:hypothetical protein